MRLLTKPARCQQTIRAGAVPAGSSEKKIMVSRQLYSAITATTQGTVYFDIPYNTTVRAIQFAIASTGTVTGDWLHAEVTLSPSAQTAVNDAQGVLAVASLSAVTSLQTDASLNATLPVNIQLKAGTRIYLNATENGSSTWVTRAVVWFD